MATWVVLPIVTPLAVMGVLCASCGGGTSLVGDGAEADAALGDEDQTADDAPVEGVEAADDSAEAAIDGAGRCGDGVRDAHEDCDDRPANNDERPNACRTTCVRAFCRDRVVDSGELSADGNPDPCDGCGGCALATARDRRPGEECDDCNSDNTDACIGGFIALARCGDGHVWRGHEECDDGNEVAGDGCESDCRWTCETAWDCNDSDECSGVETCGADHVCLPGVPLPDGSPCCPWGPEDCTDPWAEGWCVDGHCESYAMCGDGYVRAGYEECDLAPRSCETTCGSVGSEECAETCVWSGVCTPPAEACNGVDDDCDGAIDEDPCPEDCCTDRLDNDHDGFADCEDPDCVTDPWCTPCRDGPRSAGTVATTTGTAARTSAATGSATTATTLASRCAAGPGPRSAGTGATTTGTSSWTARIPTASACPSAHLAFRRRKATGTSTPASTAWTTTATG